MQQTSVQKTREQSCLVCGYALPDEAVRCEHCGTPVVDRGTQDLASSEKPLPANEAAVPAVDSGRRDWLMTAAVAFVLGITSLGLLQQILSGPLQPAPQATYLVINGRPEQLAWVVPQQASAALAAQAVVATPRQLALLHAITQGTYERAFDVGSERLKVGVVPFGAMQPGLVPEGALLVRSYLNPQKGGAMLVAYVALPAQKAKDAAFQKEAATKAIDALNGLPIR